MLKKFRIGVIGCGAIFFVHAFSLYKQKNTEIAAVCDIKPEALEMAKQLFQCNGYSNYKEMLQREYLDAVHILTPHYLHAPMVIDAANAGKHVLTEKPMAINMDQAHAMIEAGKRNNVIIGVISQNRYNAASVAIKKAISSGSLGKILGQRIILSWYKPAEYYKRSDWHGTWDKEGGSLMIDQAIHVMDLARWFIGEEIQSVEATITNRNHPEIETEDTSEGIITYQSGIKSVFFATNNFTYNSPVVVETHCEKGTALMEFERGLISYMHGEEISVVNDPTSVLNEEDIKAFFNMESSQLATQTLKEWGVVMLPLTWKRPKVYWGVTHNKQIENFYSSLEKGIQPDISAEVAIKTQALICGIYQSAKEGRTIEIGHKATNLATN